MRGLILDLFMLASSFTLSLGFMTADVAIDSHSRSNTRSAATPSMTMAASAAEVAVAAHATSLDPDREPTVGCLLIAFGRHDSKSRQPENPRTISLRSHSSSLGCTSREDDAGWSGAKWDRVSDAQAAEQ